MKKNEKENVLPLKPISEIPQNYDKQISKVLDNTVDLTFISEKEHGKTVACMNLAQKITENAKNRLVCFESFPKWCNEFPNASFLEIPQNWIVETEKALDLENTWIRNETSYTVLHGDIISEFLNQNRHCVFLINNDDIEAISFFIYSVVYRFYRQKYDLLRKGYPITEHVYFILEEAQNSLDAKILSSKLFRRYRKLFSEARNMGLRWILITQRLQDLSTYFRCRTSLAIGKIGLDDFDLKLKRMLKPIGNEKRILNLPIGSFYFSSINDIVKFPKFQPSKASEWKPKPMPKPQKQSILAKIPLVRKLYAIHLREREQQQKQAITESESEDYTKEDDAEDRVTEDFEEEIFGEE